MTEGKLPNGGERLSAAFIGRYLFGKVEHMGVEMTPTEREQVRQAVTLIRDAAELQAQIARKQTERDRFVASYDAEIADLQTQLDEAQQLAGAAFDAARAVIEREFPKPTTPPGGGGGTGGGQGQPPPPPAGVPRA